MRRTWEQKMEMNTDATETFSKKARDTVREKHKGREREREIMTRKENDINTDGELQTKLRTQGNSGTMNS